jgi:hypothetical protein
MLAEHTLAARPRIDVSGETGSSLTKNLEQAILLKFIQEMFSIADHS